MELIVLVPASDSGCFERPHGPVLERYVSPVRVVNNNWARPFFDLDLTFLDERSQAPADAVDVPHSSSEIERMRIQISQGTAPGHGLVQSPRPRFLGICQPVLEVPPPKLTKRIDLASVGGFFHI